MNRAYSLVAVSLALLTFGCGGSTVSSPPPAGLNLATLTTPQIESVVFPSSGSDPYAPVVEDSQNIQVGELIEFELVAYDQAGGRHVLPATNWRWSDSSNQYGTLDPFSGLFKVGETSMPAAGLVNVTLVATGATFATKYLVNPYQARIIGKVIGSDTNAGLRGIEIDFFDSSLDETATVVTSYDGTFRASSKTTAVQFTVNPDSIPSTYWQQFSYGANPAFLSNPTTQAPLLVFDAGSDTCMTMFQTMFTRSGSQIGTSLIPGDNVLFNPAQPSLLLAPIAPATASDPGVIVISSKATYLARPPSTGCSG